jgi:hypothetical protein
MTRREPVWTVKCQVEDGRSLDTGKGSDSLGQAKEMASEMAWEMPFTTFYVVNARGRVPVVYHFWRDPLCPRS